MEEWRGGVIIPISLDNGTDQRIYGVGFTNNRDKNAQLK